jgi:carbon monoxide dehydrogenase subunit G
VDLEHSFSVPVGVDEAWKVLLDYERVARLLPGASLQSVDGDELTGAFKVKLGPVNLNYKGSATVVEKDELAHRARLNATGTDARNGEASAAVTVTVRDDGEGTTVQVRTELQLTGKPAQFGHAVMADVGSKLIGRFATALAADLGADEPAGTAPAYSTPPADEDATAEIPPPAQRARPKPSRAGEPKAEEPAEQPLAAQAPAEQSSVEDTTPAYSTPGGGVSADAVPPVIAAPLVNGSSALGRDVARDLSDAEPLELIKSAGPALGKRIAGPAAVALVIALLAARRRRG